MGRATSAFLWLTSLHDRPRGLTRSSEAADLAAFTTSDALVAHSTLAQTGGGHGK